MRRFIVALTLVALFFVLAVVSENRIGALPTPRPAPTARQAKPFPVPDWFDGPSVRAPATDSLPYNDPANGISFRYPLNLKVVRPPLDNNIPIPGLVSIVELWPADNTHPVLLVVVRGCDAPGATCMKEESLRETCHSFEAFTLGNSRALQCVAFGTVATFGRAASACYWSAHVIREGRQIDFRAPSAADAINGRTHGRDECAKGMTEIRNLDPIKAILASFVFDK